MSSPMEIEEAKPVAAPVETPVVEQKPIPEEKVDPNKPKEKYKKYEAEYTQRLIAKYFSDKDIYGDNIFKDSAANGGTILASRFPGTYSYANPVEAFMERKTNSVDSKEERETILQTNDLSNGNPAKNNE